MGVDSRGQTLCQKIWQLIGMSLIGLARQAKKIAINRTCELREALKKKNGKKRGGGGQPQFPFLAQIYRNLSGHQITQKLTQTPWKYNFLSHFLSFLGLLGHF